MGNAVKVAEFVRKAMKASGKSAEQLAAEVDLPNGRAVEMICEGSMKLPIAKVGVLADSLGVGRKSLMSITLDEYMPEAWTEIRKVYDLQ